MGVGVNGNLVPLSERDPEEAFEIRSRGGQACASAQRRRKELKETLIELLAMGNTQEELCSKLISGEMSPSTFLAIRDTIGEKPIEVKKEIIEGSITGITVNFTKMASDDREEEENSSHGNTGSL